MALPLARLSESMTFSPRNPLEISRLQWPSPHSSKQACFNSLHSREYQPVVSSYYVSACAQTVTPLGRPFARSSPTLEECPACSKDSLHVCRLKNSARVNRLTLLDSVGRICKFCLYKKMINSWDIFSPRIARSFGVSGQCLANSYSRDVQPF